MCLHQSALKCLNEVQYVHDMTDLLLLHVNILAIILVELEFIPNELYVITAGDSTLNLTWEAPVSNLSQSIMYEVMI